MDQVLHLARKQTPPPHPGAQDGWIIEQQLVDDLECVGISANDLGLKSFGFRICSLEIINVMPPA